MAPKKAHPLKRPLSKNLCELNCPYKVMIVVEKKIQFHVYLQCLNACLAQILCCKSAIRHFQQGYQIRSDHDDNVIMHLGFWRRTTKCGSTVSAPTSRLPSTSSTQPGKEDLSFVGDSSSVYKVTRLQCTMQCICRQKFGSDKLLSSCWSYTWEGLTDSWEQVD